ncbi:MAG: hypothetical protein V3T26_05965 [candidate division NC10 bacterium]
MDPNETLRRIDEFLLAQEEGVEVDIWCQDLWDWIQKGGFEPNWEAYSLGTSYYQCREVHLKKGERV